VLFGHLHLESTIRQSKPYSLQYDNESINNRSQFSITRSGDLQVERNRVAQGDPALTPNLHPNTGGCPYPHPKNRKFIRHPISGGLLSGDIGLGAAHARSQRAILCRMMDMDFLEFTY
jgi:hypothetical protein